MKEPTKEQMKDPVKEQSLPTALERLMAEDSDEMLKIIVKHATVFGMKEVANQQDVAKVVDVLRLVPCNSGGLYIALILEI